MHNKHSDSYGEPYKNVLHVILVEMPIIYFYVGKKP